jgi:DNA-directed RNA polymerase specialized sigma24 family protein
LRSTVVDRDEALAHLPEPYAVALRLRAVDSDDETIAAALDVPVQSVAALLEIADAKLAELQAT